MNMQSLYLRLFLYLFLLIPSVLLGQGSKYENHPAMKTRPDGALVPISATVAICTQPANTSTTPCSPLANLYSDSTLANVCSGTLKDGSLSGATNCSNPLVTDVKGNYHFYGATSQLYTIQVYGSGIVTSAETDVLIPPGPLSNISSTINPGVFTSGTQVENSTISVGGSSFPFSTFFNGIINSSSPSWAIDAFASGMIVPVGATGNQFNGIAGYVRDDADSSGITPFFSPVAVFGLCQSNSNNGKCWGANFVSVAAAGKTNSVIFGTELNLGGSSSSDSLFGIWLDEGGTRGVTPVQPSRAEGFHVVKPSFNGTTASKYDAVIDIEDGAGGPVTADATHGAIVIGAAGPISGGTSLPSGAIVFNSRNSGGSTVTTTLQTDQNGFLQMNGAAIGMVRLADTLLGSPAASITFSSIPATYKHLKLEVQARSSAATVFVDIGLQFNSDSGNNYDTQTWFGNNVTTTAAVANASTVCNALQIYGANATRANTAGAGSTDIPNYAGTTFEKQAVSSSGAADSTAANMIFLNRICSWRNTAAITSITLIPSSGNFVTGSRATLYGLN